MKTNTLENKFQMTNRLKTEKEGVSVVGNGLSQYQLAVIQVQPLCVSAAERPLASAPLSLILCPQDKDTLGPRDLGEVEPGPRLHAQPRRCASEPG